MRVDNREDNQLRQVSIEPDVIRNAEGSVQISFGQTRLICTASVDENVPRWMSGSRRGWVSAEYGMLPRSTHDRIRREKGSNSGRSQEISRLISRSLRGAVNLEALGERQIYIDCDVIEADGGTRTAAITGGFVALGLALRFLKEQNQIQSVPLNRYVSAISVGLQGSQPLLDLNYDEDSTISTDMNFVMTDKNEFVEIQGTAEANPFTREEFDQMAAYAQKGCQELFLKQAEILSDFFEPSQR